jgi:hypothetical protein
MLQLVGPPCNQPNATVPTITKWWTLIKLPQASKAHVQLSSVVSLEL